MRNLLFTLNFDGTDYHGWQVQNNAKTVQSTFQSATESIIGVRDNIIGCSRTDAGVHANMYCCNMRTESELSCETFVKALNAVLPRDIAVISCKEVPYEFHARYDCKSKEYIYRIWNSENKNPFLYKYSLQHKYPLDDVMLNKVCRDYIGEYDYSSFCSQGSSVESMVRNVKSCSLERDGDLVTFRVEADGFLYNMVRIMVGTVIDISAGKIASDEIPAIIQAKSRNRAGFTAPPQGLFLNKIVY